MTQRNFKNARNMGDGPKGKSKKSAGSAKIKSKAGASVYSRSKNTKTKDTKNNSAATNKTTSAEQKRRREQVMASKVRDLPEYKFWRRIWWILMCVAFVIIFASWVPGMLVMNGILDESYREMTSAVTNYGFIAAIIALIGAFYIDFRKIRKLQKNQEMKARKLSKSEARELDAAIAESDERAQARRAARKEKLPWNKKKQETSEDMKETEPANSTDNE